MHEQRSEGVQGWLADEGLTEEQADAALAKQLPGADICQAVLLRELRGEVVMSCARRAGHDHLERAALYGFTGAA